VKIRCLMGKIQVALCAVLAGCAASAPAPTAASLPVPEPLRVPETQGLTARLHAMGVQVYQCQPGKNDPTLFEWSFKQPEADLSTQAGKSIGKHYAGPTWEAHDGSKVIGELVARSDSPKSDSIPWLLLRAKTTSGAGLFSGVTFIQRLDTAGGSAPAGGCRPDQTGQQLRVPYTADYVFYGMKP
jgi:FtsP/CotA-like multicopper oxidase with cupredoxin domain